MKKATVLLFFLATLLIIFSHDTQSQTMPQYVLWQSYQFSGSNCLQGWTQSAATGFNVRCTGNTVRFEHDNMDLSRQSAMAWRNNVFPPKQSVAIETRFRYLNYDGYGNDAITIMPSAYNGERTCFGSPASYHSGPGCTSSNPQIEMLFSHGNISTTLGPQRSAKMRATDPRVNETKVGWNGPEAGYAGGQWVIARWQYNHQSNVWTLYVYETNDAPNSSRDPYNYRGDENAPTAVYTLTGQDWWPYSVKLGHHILFDGSMGSPYTYGAWTEFETDYLKIWTVASADLSVTKTDSPDPVYRGDQLTYDITVRNNGPNDALDVMVEDFYPANTTLISVTPVSGNASSWNCTPSTTVHRCSISALAPDRWASWRIVVTIPPTYQLSEVRNTATVSSTTNDPNPNNNTSSTVTTVLNSGDLAITKTDRVDPVSPNEVVTWDITVTNLSTVASSDVWVTDIIQYPLTNARIVSAAGGWWCEWTPPYLTNYVELNCAFLRTLQGGATTPPIVIEAVANPGFAYVENTATVTSSNDSNPTNNSDYERTDVVISGNLRLDKQGPGSVVAGDFMDYSIYVENTSDVAMSNIVVTDTIPSGTTFVSASGSNWQCSATLPLRCTRNTIAAHSTSPAINVRIQVPGDFPGSQVINSACVSVQTGRDINPNDNCDNVTTTVIKQTDLTLGKTASPASTTPGTTVSWFIRVRNLSATPASNVVVTDDVPAELTFISASGRGWTCSYNAPRLTCTRATLSANSNSTINLVTTVPTTISANRITNTACVATTTNEPDITNNCGNATVVLEGADLQIVKTDEPDPAMPGNIITYRLQVNNNGPFTAMNVVVKDNLPSELTFERVTAPPGWACTANGNSVKCTASQLLNQATASIMIEARVLSSVTGGTVVINSATISSSTFDADLSNNTDQEDTTITDVWNIVNPSGHTFAHIRTSAELAPDGQNENDYLANEIAYNHFQVFAGTGFGFHLQNVPHLCLSHISPCPAGSIVPAIVRQESFRIDSIHAVGDETDIPFTISGGDSEVPAFNRFVQPVPANCTAGKCVGYELYANSNYAWDVADDLIHVVFLLNGGHTPSCKEGYNCIIVQDSINPGTYQIEGTVRIVVEYLGYPDLTQTFDLAATANFELVAPHIQP